MDEPAVKRLKFESRKSQEATGELKRKSPPSLESLNGDCCLAIFEMLPLNDLCSVSNTCQRFQDLSKDVYRRRYKSRVLIVKKMTWSGNLKFGPNEKYTEYFTQSIQNLVLGRGVSSKAGLGFEGLKRLKGLYGLNAENEESGDENDDSHADLKTGDGPISTPIKNLRFEDWRWGIRDVHGPVLADIVQGVEAVTLSNSKVVGDLNKNLLQFLPNMKSLTLWNDVNKTSDDTYGWMEKTYPKLEYFAWHLKNEVPVEKLKQFIQANPNIQTFSLLSESQKTINDLLDKDIGVDELFFDIYRFDDIANALDDLRNLCEMQTAKRIKLHLKFSDWVRWDLSENLNQLAVLAPYIVGLYFENRPLDDDLIKVIVKFENLKMIQLNIPSVKEAKWLTTIPSLEQIFVYREYAFPHKYEEVLMMLTGRMANLKKIYTRKYAPEIDEFSPAKLNAERRKLVGAHKLKIYFKSRVPANAGRLKDPECEFDKIEALRVETENFNNPLVTEYLTIKEVGKYF